MIKGTGTFLMMGGSRSSDEVGHGNEKKKKTVKIINFNKKQYYITEGHIDEDGNEYEKDYSGPFTLNKARRLMEYYFKSSYHFRNPYNLNIRGPGL